MVRLAMSRWNSDDQVAWVLEYYLSVTGLKRGARLPLYPLVATQLDVAGDEGRSFVRAGDDTSGLRSELAGQLGLGLAWLDQFGSARDVMDASLRGEKVIAGMSRVAVLERLYAWALRSGDVATARGLCDSVIGLVGPAEAERLLAPVPAALAQEFGGRRQ